VTTSYLLLALAFTSVISAMASTDPLRASPMKPRVLIDDQDVRRFGVAHGLRPAFHEMAHHDLAVHAVLGAAKGKDENLGLRWVAVWRDGERRVRRAPSAALPGR
jgi:hypothetical protein